MRTDWNLRSADYCPVFEHMPFFLPEEGWKQRKEGSELSTLWTLPLLIIMALLLVVIEN
jgi:hypothetical protein